MKKKLIPIIGSIAVIFAAFLWGLDGVVLTPSLYHLNVPVVVFLLHFIAFMFMFPFFIKEVKEIKRLDKKDWFSFIWVALFGGAIGTMAITKALFYVNFVHLSIVVLLQKLQPVFAILLAMLILKEKPKKNFFMWTTLALIGSYLVTFGFSFPNISLANKTLIAALLSVLAAFAWGSSTVFSKRAIQKVNFRVGTYLRFGITSIIMVFIVLLTRSVPGFFDIHLKEILIMLLIALTTGGGAIFIYYYGLKKISASTSTICELAFPVTAIILDFFIHGNILSVGQIIGAILLVGAIYKVVNLK